MLALYRISFFQGLLRIWVRREWQQSYVNCILPIYAVLAGEHPSVWRAVL